MGVLLPLLYGHPNAVHRSHIGSIDHVRGVDPEISHTIQGETNGGTVAIYQPFPLEIMADDGDSLRPSVALIVPELDDREEHIVIRVQGATLHVDSRRVLWGEKVKVPICRGKFSVTRCFGF